jgi:integrase
MAIKTEMTWEKAKLRWRKMYRGRIYTVSCKELGVPATKEASYQAARAWWRVKRAELDGAVPPHPFEDVLETLEFRRDWCRRHDQPDEAAVWAQRIEDVKRSPVSEDTNPWTAVVSPSVAERIEFLERVGATIPGGIDPLSVEYQVGDGKLWHSRYWADRQAEAVPDDKTVARQVKAWLATLEARVSAGDFSPDHYDNVIDIIRKFEAFVGTEALVERINEETLERYHLHLIAKVAERRKDPASGMSPEYARKVFRLAKQFVKYCWSKRLIEMPRNFGNKFSFGASAKRIETMAIEEFRELFDAATGQTRLHLLLMANCGFYPIDISDLKDKEVDWEAGRVVRKRSKTAEHEDVPTVEYKLWPETLALLKKFRSGMGQVLLTKTGQPWVNNRREDGKLVSCNSVESNYTNLKRKVSKARKSQGLPAFTKPLSLIRKTSASLIESKAEYGRYVPHFLGHSPRSVADKHYRAPSKKVFDEILDWLGKEYGFLD